MPFTNDTKINISLKKLLGKTQSDNAKGPANEAIKSFVSIAAETVFGRAIPTTPNKTNIYDITDGTVEWVRLEAIPDPSANGHAFLLRLPASYSGSSNNPKAGTGFWVSGQPLNETAGAIQIVPDLFALDYEAKPYTGGTATQGSGSLVAPGDTRDWSLDYAAGVLFQEDDPASAPVDIDYVECLIYVGEMATDMFTSVEAYPIAEGGNPAVTTTEIIDAVPLVDAKSIKWIVHAQKGTAVYSCTVYATNDGATASKYNRSDILMLGGGSGAFFRPTVTVSGANMELSGTTNDTDVVVDVTRIYAN